MYINKHMRPLACSALSELGFESHTWECSSPCGTIDMGIEGEECKHVFNMNVSVRTVLAVIVYQVSIVKRSNNTGD